ncbi:MAG: penicillin-binding protein 2 [Sedimentisphaerales bacterium]|nr:penicillin-binding protein 2 [Sedimentisphaerales bacterium]
MKNARTIIIFALFLIGAFFTLIGRCLYLQLYKGEHYLDAASHQQQAYTTRQPQRGGIFDCRGRVLAASNKIQIIKAEPRIIDEPKEISSELAPILNMGAHEICKLIVDRRNTGYVRIKVDADPCECSLAKRVHRGIGVESDWQRYYPTGSLMSNIVGFTDPYGRGLEGIELKYNKELVGSSARNIFLADVRRRPIRPQAQDGVLTNGVGIILTIDATIQQFVRDELMKQYLEYEAESAVGIVAEPKTGAILAMVSLPDFDPTNRNCDPNNFRSRALTDWYEPGSVIKPFTVAIALDAGAIKENDVIFCENGSYSGRGFGTIGEYRRGFGNLSIAEILIHSSNIGMAKIGQKLGKEKLYKGLRLFGFGSRTGIELPGEVYGLLRSPDTWDGYSITRIPWGQEICVTGIQLIQAFCILANGGRLVRPFIVRAVVDQDGQIKELKRPPPPVGYIIKPEIAEWLVTNALSRVVSEGSGKRAKLDKWQVFGKTGTANIALANARGYSDRNYMASFLAGAPVEDPAIVVLVSIRRPNRSLGKGYSGGVVASPVAARIIERTLTYLGVE